MATTEQVLNRVAVLYKRLTERRSGVKEPGITELEDAFEGKQPLAYASPEWREFHNDRYEDFADNWCEVVGRAAPDRTRLTGIRLGDDAQVQSADEKLLWRDWEINNGPATSRQAFLTMAVARRDYALVWGNRDDEPVVTFEHPSQVIIGYDDNGVPVDALKVWVNDDGDTEFATYYTDTEAWKFFRPILAGIVGNRTASGIWVPEGLNLPGGWEPRPTSKTGDDTWPAKHPMGVLPVVELENRPSQRKGAISDISGTLAMQKAINLFWAYLFGAADHASLPARVVMGQEPPKIPVLDEDGQKIGEQQVSLKDLAHGRLLWLTGKDTTIGKWDAAKLDVFTAAIHVMVKHVASQTRTPIHYIMGELGNVNGETLKATEMPLATKVREGHDYLTRPVREIFRRMALVRGNKGAADACRTAVTQWMNPETSTDAQTSDAALKDSQIGWPFAAILERQYGLSQPEIQRVLDMKRAEAEDPLIEKLANGLAGGGFDAAGDAAGA